jgi:hypothetical protein
MISSDLPSPAEAPSQMTKPVCGFAQAGNRFSPSIQPGTGWFGIVRQKARTS